MVLAVAGKGGREGGRVGVREGGGRQVWKGKSGKQGMCKEMSYAWKD